MTFDDGILTVYKTKNVAAPGEKPVVGLVEKSKHYFGFGDIGISRYYTALQAGQQISAVVNIPDWHDIEATDICILEDKKQYRIAMAQPTTDENGLRIMKLSMERTEEVYAFKTTCS